MYHCLPYWCTFNLVNWLSFGNTQKLFLHLDLWNGFLIHRHIIAFIMVCVLEFTLWYEYVWIYLIKKLWRAIYESTFMKNMTIIYNIPRFGSMVSGQELWWRLDHLGPNVRNIPGRTQGCQNNLRTRKSTTSTKRRMESGSLFCELQLLLKFLYLMRNNKKCLYIYV